MSVFIDNAQNIIETAPNAPQSVVTPRTSAAVNPNVDPTGASNRPLNAAPVVTSDLQITSNGAAYLASWSNPA